MKKAKAYREGRLEGIPLEVPAKRKFLHLK
jgi:hypothetical protein